MILCDLAQIEMLNATGRFHDALKWLQRVSELEPHEEKVRVTAVPI